MQAGNNNKPSVVNPSTSQVVVPPVVTPPTPSVVVPSVVTPPTPPVVDPPITDDTMIKDDDTTTKDDDTTTKDDDDCKISNYSCGEPVEIPKCKPTAIPITLELAPIVNLLVDKPKVCLKNKAVCKPCFFLNQ